MKYSYWSYYLWVNTVQYRLYRPHVDNYLLTYMNVKRLKSPGYVVWTPEIRIPKQILKGSFRDKKTSWRTKE
jgi:hypothetical protein